MGIERERLDAHFNGVIQHRQIDRANNFESPEAFQMRRLELSIEQLVSIVSQQADQINERDLAGVSFTGKHALAEKGTPHRNAV